MEVAVSQVYTSVSCNRTPEIVDWNGDGLICYGASNAIVIYDTKIKGKHPLTVLSHHRARVNSVKWLRKPNGSSIELVSCSADKTAVIWSLKDGEWTATASLQGHKDGVMCIHGTYHKDKLFIFSGSIDSTVKVWERNEDGSTQLKHTIPLQSGLCLTIHCYILPVVDQPILFCALDDHKIHVFTGEDFHRVHQMIGHEDWVRGLDVMALDDSSIILASCSQDTYIRLWRVQRHTSEGMNISVEKKVFQAYEEQWEVTLEAVLGGHEGWVYGVHWHPPVVENGEKKVVQKLLSSSLDKSLIVWAPEQSGAWTERVRLGEVGGSGLGFYGSRFGPRGEVLAHGYNGSFHIWKYCLETNQWQPSVVCGGHFNAVEDVRWEPTHGRYIMSLSADQTTRVHAPWKKPDGTSEWHELARPQVHGYDMQSLALVSGTVFASAAEEKVIRVFQATNNFVHNFANITGEVLEERTDQCIAEGASVPSLGLSNKAVFSGEEGKQDTDDDGYFVPMNLTEPPTEETLMQNTLWPEQQKLYGHGYEVFALAASPDATLLASACKATTPEHAALILWSTKSWNQIQTLPSHALTVTQIEFSPNSQFLLSVSRDRRWSLFRRRQGTDSFELAACTDKTNGVHARIVWCCGWSCDGDMFSTGSRDGKVCVWSKTETHSETSLKEYGLYGKALELKESVTAVAFAPIPGLARVVAVGTETGTVRVYRFDGMWSLIRELDHSAAHHLTVKRVAFKPRREDDGAVLMASAGADHLVRIYRLTIA